MRVRVCTHSVVSWLMFEKESLDSELILLLLRSLWRQKSVVINTHTHKHTKRTPEILWDPAVQYIHAQDITKNTHSSQLFFQLFPSETKCIIYPITSNDVSAGWFKTSGCSSAVCLGSLYVLRLCVPLLSMYCASHSHRALSSSVSPWSCDCASLLPH